MSTQQQNIAALRKQALDVGWDRAAKVAEAGIKQGGEPRSERDHRGCDEGDDMEQD